MELREDRRRGTLTDWDFAPASYPKTDPGLQGQTLEKVCFSFKKQLDLQKAGLVRDRPQGPVCCTSILETSMQAVRESS